MRGTWLRLWLVVVATASCAHVAAPQEDDGIGDQDVSGGPPPSPVLELLAGDIGGPGNRDDTGPAARFRSPTGVAIDSAGNVYVADQANHTIRKVTPAGSVTTLAGTAGQIGSADGTGSIARFNLPFDAAVDSQGNIYVDDRATTPSARSRRLGP